ncbi:hypothetical protein [Confluentibacter flavum]|uniref:Uncharacterized protein n=1 Tax=Confluentibacter flavum TaxID=1909700 RepID=A0A2N3HP51_9FLAO|nr:hypothetical protein [Confluentibacter flavum]PKQ46763.1 hypothetical protein CSW08_01270 [Confluentibacter flavum]
MKNITLLLFFAITLASCQENKKKADVTDDFEKSYKEQKDSDLLPEHTEHFDSINNLYSNYKYKVAFDAPNHWTSDAGVSEHTIFRTFQPDSAITFAINVIELKVDENEKAPDIWEMYQTQSEKMDYPFKVLIPKQFNSKAEDFIASKTYIKNKTTLKRKFKYLVRELELEYYNTSIVYQTLIDNLTYTFSLDIPTMFYDENPSFYDNLIRNVTFLYGKEDVNKYLNKKEN